MKKTLAALGVMYLCAAVSFASTINSSTAINGTTFSGFDNGPEKGTDLGGAIAFVGGDQCTFITVASNSVCTGTGFTITLTPPTAITGSATWNIHNNATAGTGAITSLTLNLQPANSVFFACVDKGGAIVQKNCANGGQSVQSVSAGSAITGNVLYTNLATDLLSSGGHPYSPLYGEITFSWAAQVFTGGLNFSFGTDTELFAPAAATPEPATYGMVGLALAAFGMLRLRSGKDAKGKGKLT